MGWRAFLEDRIRKNQVVIIKPLTFVRGFVANIVLHSNQMWRDLREFYSLVGVFKKFYKL